MEIDIKEVHSHLKSHGIRPLPHKVSIMKYLLERYNHPTIEQIYSDLLPMIPTLSKTTIYNSIKLYCEKKAVNVLYIDEKNLRYEAHTHPHAHFRCKKCGAIHDVPVTMQELTTFKCPENLHPHETHLYFFGLCEKCL